MNRNAEGFTSSTRKRFLVDVIENKTSPGKEHETGLKVQTSSANDFRFLHTRHGSRINFRRRRHRSSAPTSAEIVHGELLANNTVSENICTRPLSDVVLASYQFSFTFLPFTLEWN